MADSVVVVSICITNRRCGATILMAYTTVTNQ
jgi:hypothetical protein